MNSRIYTGTIAHARLQPAHRFAYPVYLYALDLDELEQLNDQVRGFGYNRRSVVSIHDADYLREGPGSIREKLMALLEEAGCAEGITRIELVTAARVLNYVFNPVSFYYCYDAEGRTRCLVAEVNNTFKEKHVYLLPEPESVDADGTLHYREAKAFHVSPFYDMSGEYDFRFAPLGEHMDIDVNKRNHEGVHFTSSLQGVARPLTSRSLARTLARYPFTASLTMPRILSQATRLYFSRRLPVYVKPAPASIHTLRAAPPNLRQRSHRRLVCHVLKRMRRGQLLMHLPDGSEVRFGDREAEPIEMTVKDWQFFTKVFRGADVGFGEAWVDGDFACNDLTALLQLFLQNKDLAQSRRWLGRKDKTRNRRFHRARKNTIDRSRKNIQEHYDLSNDFFKEWLDPTMTYSCALYAGPGQPLEDAQRNKIAALIEKADIGPDHHVLEIGCGWGGFAIEAVRRTGCRVTGLTLSEKQKAFAEKRIAEAGLSGRIDIQLVDYRKARGQYDRIVSIEMLEAVGDEYFETYFSTCEQLLKPGGKMSLQVITIPHQRFDAYRKNCDWIQKYIFPGGLLPSKERLLEAIANSSHLAVDHVDEIGLHYATTLREWRERFEQKWGAIKQQDFDENFRRMWNYYLSYCEAGFANHYIDVVQVALVRPLR